MRLHYTPRMLRQLEETNSKLYEAVIGTANFMKSEDVFADLSCGYVKLEGIPRLT